MTYKTKDMKDKFNYTARQETVYICPHCLCRWCDETPDYCPNCKVRIIYTSKPAVSDSAIKEAARNEYPDVITKRHGFIRGAKWHQSLNVQGDAQPRYDCDTCRYYPCASKHKVKKDGCGDYDATTKR